VKLFSMMKEVGLFVQAELTLIIVYHVTFSSKPSIGSYKVWMLELPRKTVEKGIK
jgi:hypothetical protein